MASLFDADGVHILFLPLLIGDISSLLMEGIIAEWFQMVVHVYLLWNLASTHTYLLPPLGARLILCIWK